MGERGYHVTLEVMCCLLSLTFESMVSPVRSENSHSIGLCNHWLWLGTPLDMRIHLTGWILDPPTTSCGGSTFSCLSVPSWKASSIACLPVSARWCLEIKLFAKMGSLCLYMRGPCIAWTAASRETRVWMRLLLCVFTAGRGSWPHPVIDANLW